LKSSPKAAAIRGGSISNQRQLMIDATIIPEGSLEILSQHEVVQLLDTGGGGLHELWRRCSLAVLNSGAEEDDPTKVLEQYKAFTIHIVQQDRGIKLAVTNAPASAFVDGQMIRGIREHLFAVLRDLIYIHNEMGDGTRFDLDSSEGITNAVFHILRNAGVLHATESPNVVVCWGGHAIGRAEYDYSKEVGYELGLRKLHICTGCGAGAMKGPMKGANIGHSKQRFNTRRYLGITEPSIIAAESPNPIVNELVIMPDIEKRLEAFVRVCHGIIVFPGGAGTAEEILYLLGILLDPANEEVTLPLVFTGPAASESYFRLIDDFVGATLGKQAQAKYQIVIDDPAAVARELDRGIELVRKFRAQRHDALYFNWRLAISHDFQTPFVADHENMRALQLHRDQSATELAVNLRRAFSGIVAGNVREDGIHLVERNGPFELTGEHSVMRSLDTLLRAFVKEGRMKISAGDYVPCYRVVT